MHADIGTQTNSWIQSSDVGIQCDLLSELPLTDHACSIDDEIVDDDDECLDNCRSSDESYYCDEEPEMKFDTK